MELWQFMAALKGFTISKGGKWNEHRQELSDDDLRAMGIEGF